MKNSTLIGKILSQISIFVVSGLLAGILLLAIQANKLPGIKLNDQQLPQKEDEVAPTDIESPVEENPEEENLSYKISADDSAYDKKAQTNLCIITEVPNHLISNQIKKDLISVTTNISSSSMQSNTQRSSSISKSSTAAKSSDTKKSSITTYSPATPTNTVRLPTKEKLSFSAACGFSPLFFAGHNFANDYFPDSPLIFSPVSTLGITFPEKNNFTYSLYFTAASTSLNLKSPQLYNNINLNFNSNFFLAKMDFSVMHQIISEKNLAEAHLGSGILLFNNPYCIINEVSYKKNTSFYYTLDFGISVKHFFSEQFFSAVTCDFLFVFPNSERLFIIQPALIAGLNF